LKMVKPGSARALFWSYRQMKMTGRQSVREEFDLSPGRETKHG